MQMLASYAPINKKTLAIGSVVILDQLAELPSVVKYLPLLPLCEGKASTAAHEATTPLVVVKNFPELPVSDGIYDAAVVALEAAAVAELAADVADVAALDALVAALLADVAALVAEVFA
jgi:hypothetical protein